MEDVAVQRNAPFGADRRAGADPPALRMDIYAPHGDSGAGTRPAVIIVTGYPAPVASSPGRAAYKDIGWTRSMCQLIAMSGMAAIAYTAREPAADLQTLIGELHLHATMWRIDPARLGVLAVSGNVPTALTSVMADTPHPPACAAFGYGCFLDPDDGTEVAEAARQFGFANPSAGRTIADVRRDLPLLLTRAGRDQFPAMQASLDRFVRDGLRANLPLTVANHADGPHAFDLFDDSRTSRDIVRLTLRFLQRHLLPEDGAGLLRG
jgi:hypothetical protein